MSVMVNILFFLDFPGILSIGKKQKSYINGNPSLGSKKLEWVKLNID